MGNTQRIEKWDILKGLLMFLVVLGHACEYYVLESRATRAIFLFIYMFHMPLFIFISGLFSKKLVNTLRIDKLFSYIILYVGFKIIRFLSDSYYYGLGSMNIFKATGAPWFICALIMFAVITHFVRKVEFKYVFVTSVILGCFFGYCKGFNEMFAIERVIVYYPFYYLGYSMNAKKLEELSRGKTKKIVALIVLLAIIAVIIVKLDKLYWMRYLLSARNPYSDIKYGTYGAVTRFLSYILTAVISACLIILTPDKLGNGYIAKIGQRTLGVYIFHGSLLPLIYKEFGFIEFSKGILGRYYWVLAFVVSAILTIGLSTNALHKLIVKVSNVKIKQEYRE